MDEIHAFAGDDRAGICSVLERVTQLAGQELQRIGLSATVGNPELLIDWLAGSCSGQRTVYRPTEATAAEAEVKLDYVGSLENAAVVISRLHRGEKRLVFLDSRARAEELGAGLRQRGVTAFVTHSSLSQEQRRQAEDAFANRDDCVIVATSVLELGIDVGNLDRVIQIDSPSTVSSFLQRMSRTGRGRHDALPVLGYPGRDLGAGRRPDRPVAGGLRGAHPAAYETVPCFGPATDGPGAAGAGHRQAHVAGMGQGVPAFSQMPPAAFGKSWPGCWPRSFSGRSRASWGLGAGRGCYGRRHFLELLSVFLTPPLFAIAPRTPGVGLRRRVDLPR